MMLLRHAVRAALLACALVLAAAPAARAGVDSHNGVDITSSNQNGTGALQNVGLYCPLGSAACYKFWTGLGGVHTINMTGQQFVESVYNETGVTWTDYHFSATGMDLAILAIAGPQDMIVQEATSSIDLFFPSGIPASSEAPAFLITLGFTYHDGVEVGVLSQYPTTAPEPASLVLFGAGLLGLAAARRRKAA